MLLRRTFTSLVGIGLAILLGSCSILDRGPVGNESVPEPAKAIDLQRYSGLWYEMARYENGFERGCEGVTAKYSLRPDGLVRVVNTCREGSPDGPAKAVTGRAKIVEGSRNAKLKVSFFGPFFGDYWVVDRANDYTWSIVGEPSGRYLWLLTRTAQPSPEVQATLRQRARDLGYDVALTRATRH